MRLSILAFSVSVIVVLAIVVLDPVSRIWDLTLFGDMEELCWGVLSLYVLENQAASHIPGSGSDSAWKASEARCAGECAPSQAAFSESES